MKERSDFAIGIDWGSNTLRAVKRACAENAFVAEYERIVRTADGLAETGRISPEAVERVAAALDEANAQIGFENARLRAVTTEALRRASNAREVLSGIEERTGIAFDVIDGAEEARLTLKAVRNRLKILGKESESFALVDIGGGSTELIYRVGERMRSRSFPLGIVTLSQEGASLSGVERLLPERLEPLKHFIRETEAELGPVKELVATAGTPTTVAAMKQGMEYADYDARRINGTILERGELSFWLKRLLAMRREERERAVGVGREDLIAAGILIFEGIFEVTGFDHCIVIDDGLREGVAIELCER